MDGFSRKFLFLSAFLFLTLNASAESKSNFCNFGCKTDASFLEQFLVNKKNNCSYPKPHALESRSLSLGVEGVDPLGKDSYQFLTEALRVQGLRINSSEGKLANTFISSLEKSDCFFHPDGNLKDGDLAVGKNQILILNHVSADPFQIQKIIEVEGAKVPQNQIEKTCDDWTSNVAQFQFEVFHEVANSKTHSIRSERLVPALGTETSSSVWVTYFHELAKKTCVAQVLEKQNISPSRAVPSERRLASVVASSIHLLRHQSDQELCVVPCAACCDHRESSGGSAK